MICCGIGALAIAAAAFRRRLQSSLGSAVVIASMILALTFGALHFEHYAERARANERSLLAELVAQPICTGTVRAPAAVRQSRRASAFSNSS
jgi:hypothetical protein